TQGSQSNTVRVSFNGQSDNYEYKVSGRIIVRMGEGNDTFDASGVTSANITYDIEGGAGDDTIKVGAGNAIVHGGAGDDHIFGGAGNDIIYGELGSDEIHGGGGNDIIFADGGGFVGANIAVSVSPDDSDDQINGDGGDDIIFGGGGNDTIHG